ncbi:hypothetical protein NTG1052_370012 [Candidatus Nitrotoga sp. 1052]|nr:hypothetical protein NTG1052_370012 [Candidatus Nitrotoga sp. 1052]
MHGKDAAPDNKTRHARFPHPNPLPVGEGANELLREFHGEGSKIQHPATCVVLAPPT